MKSLALLLLLPLALPIVDAQETTVIVEDPARDAGPSGAVLPAGAEAWDLVRVSLAGETPEVVRLRFDVAALASAPPVGEVALHFRIGDDYWLAGWTTVVFPAPPFTYQGGFYCPTDASFNPDTDACAGLESTVGGGAYEVTLVRSLVGATDAGAVLDKAWAYADLYNYDGESVRMDRTIEANAYTFATGNLTARGEGGNVSVDVPNPQPAEPAPPQESAGSGRSGPGAEAPTLGAWAVLGLSAGMAWARRLRAQARPSA